MKRKGGHVMAKASGIDASDLKVLSMKLKAASKAERVEWRRGLKNIGRVVAVRAVEIIEPVSRPTAESIKVRAGNSRAAVTIVAGGPNLPIAPLLEGKGVPGTWRHPLFGNKDYWYPEDRHPYMLPAYEERRPFITQAMNEMVRVGLESADVRVV